MIRPTASPDERAHKIRFAFGKNWARFLSVLDEGRIAAAEESLCALLGVTELRGETVVDIGCGSGLFSLAAKRLGAGRIHSFDYDVDSVACTLELKRRYFPNDASWTIEQGSVLDKEYMRLLGTFDVVYSWGVLHHTGDLWRALDYATDLVRPRGRLCLAIYNDQGSTSRRWWMIKRLYNYGPRFLRPVLLLGARAYFACRTALGWIGRGGRSLPTSLGDEGRERKRGMSESHDLVDWVGGYPFEVAKPDQIFDFCQKRGFVLQYLKTVGGGLANNEFVFTKTAE